MFFQTLNIRGKLLLGFGLVLTIAALQSGVAAMRLHDVNARSSDIAKKRLPSVRLLGDLRADLARCRVDRLKMLLDGTEAEQRSASDDADAAQAAYEAHWAAYSKLIDGTEERHLADQLAVSELAYADVAPRVRALMRAHDSSALHALLIGSVLTSFNQANDDLHKLVEFNAAGAAAASAQADALFEQARGQLVAGLVLMLGSGAVIAWFIAGGLARSAGVAVAAARRISSGDLGVEVAASSRDELGRLLSALGEMQRKLRSIVSEVRLGADSVAIASAEIAASSIDLSSRTEEQASSLQETAAAMEQLSITVSNNADHTRQGHQRAVHASEVAQAGGVVVERVVETMRLINESSGRIGDIVGVIDGIAFQTNILALNAAVEAARAGEQGRGFAVVAKEVRALAQRSAEAAREITTLITSSVARVDAGVVLVEQAGQTMSAVLTAISEVTHVMGTISSSVVEQSSGVTQIEQAIGQMDQATQQNAALVEQSSAAAESLKDKASELVRTVAVFKLGDEHVTPSLLAIPASAAAQTDSMRRAPTSRALRVSVERLPALAPDGTADWRSF